MVLLLFIRCLLLLPFGVGVLRWVLVCVCISLCSFSNHLAEKEKAGFSSCVLYPSLFVPILRCVIGGGTAICNCDISWA